MKTVNRETCHDCGAKEGQLHHLGCDMERCPKCGHQLISCGCFFLDDPKDLDRLFRMKRVRYIQWPNICVRCGALWPDLFMVPDREWEKYIEMSYRDSVVCMDCLTFIKDSIDTAEREKL